MVSIFLSTSSQNKNPGLEGRVLGYSHSSIDLPQRNYGSQNVATSGVNFWNRLQTEIHKMMQTLLFFRQKLNTYVFDLQLLPNAFG